MSATSDLLVRGTILSFDLSEEPFSSMLVRNGKVAELSRFAPTPNTQHPTPVLDLDQQVIVPAFIDSHTHVLELGLQFVFPNLSRVDSLAEVFDLISSSAQLAREFDMLLAFCLEPDNLSEKRMPLRQELDRVIADRPLLIYRVDGHSASLNTVGMDKVYGGDLSDDGIDLDRYLEPTGIVASLAYEKASRWFKSRLIRDLKVRAFDLAAQEALRRGVLTVAALVGSDEPGDDISELLVERAPSLPVQTVIFAQTRSIARVQRLGLPRIGGCILIDGSFGSHSAALIEEYSDEPGQSGRLYFEDDELRSFLHSANDAGLQTAVHAIGDRAVDQVVRCYEQILVPTPDSQHPTTTLNPLRHRIEHAELLNPDLIIRIGRLGLLLGVQPAFEHYWGGPGEMYEHRLGDRYLQTNAYREMLDAGLLLVGGSDAPITEIDPVLGINVASDLPVPRHNVTRLEACRMFTDRAAYSLGLEASKGSLAPGHDADFVVLSDNPLQRSDFRVVSVFRAGSIIKV